MLIRPYLKKFFGLQMTFLSCFIQIITFFVTVIIFFASMFLFGLCCFWDQLYSVAAVVTISLDNSIFCLRLQRGFLTLV